MVEVNPLPDLAAKFSTGRTRDESEFYFHRLIQIRTVGRGVGGSMALFLQYQELEEELILPKSVAEMDQKFSLMNLLCLNYRTTKFFVITTLSYFSDLNYANSCLSGDGGFVWRRLSKERFDLVEDCLVHRNCFATTGWRGVGGSCHARLEWRTW